MAEYIIFNLRPSALKELRQRANGHTTRDEEQKWIKNIKAKISKYADRLIQDEIDNGV